MSEKEIDYEMKKNFRKVLLGFDDYDDKIFLRIGHIPIKGKFGYPSAQGFIRLKEYTFDKAYFIECLHLSDGRDYKSFLLERMYHNIFFYPDSLIASSDGLYRIEQGNYLYSFIGFSYGRYDSKEVYESFYKDFTGREVKCILFEPGIEPRVLCLSSDVREFEVFIPGDIVSCDIDPAIYSSDTFYRSNLPFFEFSLLSSSIWFHGPCLFCNYDEDYKISSFTDNEIKILLEALKNGSYVYPEEQKNEN